LYDDHKDTLVIAWTLWERMAWYSIFNCHHHLDNIFNFVIFMHCLFNICVQSDWPSSRLHWTFILSGWLWTGRPVNFFGRLYL